MIKRALIYLFLVLLWGGALAVTQTLPDPTSLKAPLMLMGMTGLIILYLPKLPLSRALIPFLAFWLFAYFRLSHHTVYYEAALMQIAVLLAFLLGFARAPLAHPWLLPPVILLCVAQGLLDLTTLSHLGFGPAQALTGSALSATAAYHVTSFFGDKHTFGTVLILGAFLHFYLMEKRDPRKPVQVFLYSSSLLVLLSILLVDSRLVQGVFFLCFLPLLFVSLKLDGREPKLERLAWITGITLSLGLAWINLPEMQLQNMVSAFSPSSPGFLPWAWASAFRTFLESPLLGTGIGGFQYAVASHQGVWPATGSHSELPTLLHAHNHFLESLAEGGAIYLSLELMLVFGACYGMLRCYFREWRLEAKYAFFALLALVLMGIFAPVLDQFPARILYWALIGYGWSILAEALPTRPFTFGAKTLAGGALVSLACLHLALRIPELLSDRLFVKSVTVLEKDPRAYTNLLVEALRLSPTHEAANYAYVNVLGQFRRAGDAVKLLGEIQKFAPNEKKRAVALAQLYSRMQLPDSSAKYATSILSWHPKHLPAMEILIDAMASQGHCRTADSLQNVVQAWNPDYPFPPPQEFTIQALDSLFESNREVVFFQRWFGGKSLRKQFVERHLSEYNLDLENYARLQLLKDTQCRNLHPPAPDSLPDPEQSHPLNPSPPSPPPLPSKPSQPNGQWLPFWGWG